jgi:hypothetical protein
MTSFISLRSLWTVRCARTRRWGSLWAMGSQLGIMASSKEQGWRIQGMCDTLRLCSRLTASCHM